MDKPIISPIRFEIPKVDTWVPNPEDIIITNARNIVIIPVSAMLNVEKIDQLDLFVIRPKKCYNSQVVREHICQVINYFEKYFDPDKELLMCISRVKFFIDRFQGQYTKENFIHDVNVYILGDHMKTKVKKMCDHNFNMDLTYKNIQAPLQYTNEHAQILLEMSIFMNFVIPLITHYAHVNRVGEIDEFIMDVYDHILTMFPANIFAKLFETSYSNVSKSEYKNAPLWMKQDIRGKDVCTHSRDSVDNIILNIMPKYAFDRNIVA